MPSTPNEPRFTIKQIELNDEKLAFAQEILRKLIIAGESGSRPLAQALKQNFDEKFGSSWHCIVGNSFGSMVSHLNNHYVYFYVDTHAVLLFKSSA